jgi:hypothetical protein
LGHCRAAGHTYHARCSAQGNKCKRQCFGCPWCELKAPHTPDTPLCQQSGCIQCTVCHQMPTGSVENIIPPFLKMQPPTTPMPHPCGPSPCCGERVHTAARPSCGACKGHTKITARPAGLHPTTCHRRCPTFPPRPCWGAHAPAFCHCAIVAYQSPFRRPAASPKHYLIDCASPYTTPPHPPPTTTTSVTNARCNTITPHPPTHTRPNPTTTTT